MRELLVGPGEGFAEETLEGREGFGPPTFSVGLCGEVVLVGGGGRAVRSLGLEAWWVVVCAKARRAMRMGLSEALFVIGSLDRLNRSIMTLDESNTKILDGWTI